MLCVRVLSVEAVIGCSSGPLAYTPEDMFVDRCVDRCVQTGMCTDKCYIQVCVQTGVCT